jgi:hypothetical protein
MTEQPKTPNFYPINFEKLKGESVGTIPYFLGILSFSEDYEYFDKIKHLLDIPEQPKSLEEIQKELDDKFEKLIEQYKRNSYSSKICAERNYENKFNRIFDKFAFAKEHGRFPQPIKWGLATGTGISALDGSYLISGGSGGNVVSWSTEFNLKSNSVGYYSIDRDIRFNMTKKPNFIVRFCMDKLLGFKWENK